MTKIRMLVMVGAAFGSVALISASAFPQSMSVPVSGNSVNYTQIVVALINLALPAVAAVATYLINANVKNSQMAALLTNAVQNGVGIVQRQAVAAAQGANLTFDVNSPEVRAGVQYVLANAAEAVAHFKIPNERIAEKISAKLGLAAIATNLATTVSPLPVIAGPMAPVSLGSRLTAV